MHALFQSAILAIALIFPVLALGQDRKEVVKTELMTLCFNGIVPSYYYMNGKKIMELTAHSQGISPPVFYSGSPVIALYGNKGDLESIKSGEDPPKPQMSARIPTGSDRVLLVFAYTDKEKKDPKLRAYGIDDSTLKEGDYRVFNLSKKKIYAVLNDKKSAVAVSSNKQGTIRSGAWGKKAGAVQAQFGIQDGKKIKRAYSSVWGHRPERRSFVFVFDNGDRVKPLNIRSFYDVPGYKPPRAGGDGPPLQ
ncbi:hypothetical protein [Haloferula sp.]|uniref:hypothetical protein n=1 Tax=Haloferula sp. TaxID=2497595 RepID=UPI00329B0510